jgi:uncharacterized integral membrane protein
MKIIHKIMYVLLFIVLFLLCLRNTTAVAFDVIFYKFNTPLVVILFISFILGVIVGTLAILPKIFKQRRQIKHLSTHAMNINYPNTHTQSNTEIKTQD